MHVPYRGSGPALQDLLAGNIQMAIDTVAVLLPHIRSGGLRALGVATLERNPSLPELRGFRIRSRSANHPELKFRSPLRAIPLTTPSVSDLTLSDVPYPGGAKQRRGL